MKIEVNVKKRWRWAVLCEEGREGLDPSSGPRGAMQPPTPKFFSHCYGFLSRREGIELHVSLCRLWETYMAFLYEETVKFLLVFEDQQNWVCTATQLCGASWEWVHQLLLIKAKISSWYFPPPPLDAVPLHDGWCRCCEANGCTFSENCLSRSF